MVVQNIAGRPNANFGGRYLHARQILLRPALEVYFRKTQSDQSSLPRKRRNGDLEALMLTEMAVKCVKSAVLIVKLLSAKSEKDIFRAWWLNIACKFFMAVLNLLQLSL